MVRFDDSDRANVMRSQTDKFGECELDLSCMTTNISRISGHIDQFRMADDPLVKQVHFLEASF